MNFFRALFTKAWIPHVAGAAFSEDEINPNERVGQIALNFFIAVVSVIFLLITITFLARSQYPDFQALAGDPWQPFTNPALLWINTAALFVSSALLHWGFRCTQSNYLNGVLIGVFGGAIFTLIFIYGQLNVWSQLNQLGFYLAANPANSYFYLFTGLHGLHLLGGLCALLYVVSQFLSNHLGTNFSKGLRLCVIYWHFLLIVWLALFALLTSTPQTYRAIAEFCGF